MMDDARFDGADQGPPESEPGAASWVERTGMHAHRLLSSNETVALAACRQWWHVSPDP